jgi:hypothetical protein
MRSVSYRGALVGVVFLACGSSSSGGGGGGTAPPPVPTGALLAQGLSIIGVAVFQGTKSDVVAPDPSGMPMHVDAPKAPVVAGRIGQLRVYVQPDDSWKPHEVTAELHVFDASGTEMPVSTNRQTITGASTDGAYASTFNFLLEDQNIVPAGATYRVALMDKAQGAAVKDGDPSPARWPNDGSTESLGAKSNGDAFHLQLVPFEYDTDGSGRLPVLTDDQIQLYKDALFKLYPVAKVDLQIHAPLPWKIKIDAQGIGWDEALQAMSDLKVADKAADNVWYVAAFEPQDQFNDYCAQGCILGLGTLDGGNDPLQRISAIVGYSGAVATDTLPQELAHTLGREHAPCGNPAGLDTKYPYPLGRIGVWGYDVLTRDLIDPASKYRDYLSYCTPIWTSDYSFAAMFKGIAHANKVSLAKESGVAEPRNYHFITVRPDGSLKWGRTIARSSPPAGAEHTVVFRGKDGRSLETVTGYFSPFSTLGGGLLQVPEGPRAFASLHVSGLAGRMSTALAR